MPPVLRPPKSLPDPNARQIPSAQRLSAQALPARVVTLKER